MLAISLVASGEIKEKDVKTSPSRWVIASWQPAFAQLVTNNGRISRSKQMVVSFGWGIIFFKIGLCLHWVKKIEKTTKLRMANKKTRLLNVIYVACVVCKFRQF